MDVQDFRMDTSAIWLQNSTETDLAQAHVAGLFSVSCVYFFLLCADRRCNQRQEKNIHTYIPVLQRPGCLLRVSGVSP